MKSRTIATEVIRKRTKKSGQFSLVLWFPEPRGGRYEHSTHRNLSEKEFRYGIEDMVTLLRKMCPRCECSEPTPKEDGSCKACGGSLAVSRYADVQEATA